MDHEAPSAALGDARPTIYLGKVWQGEDSLLCWQLSIRQAERYGLPRKAFLIVDCRQDSAGLRFEGCKAARLKSSGSITALLRKHVPSARLVGVYRREVAGKKQPGWDIAIEQGGERRSWLVLAPTKPPELTFRDPEGVVRFRFGQHGTFTKPKASEDELSEEGRANELTELVAALAANADKEAEETTGVTSAPETEGYQRDAQKKLARRVKTVRKAVEKSRKALPEERDALRAEEEARLLQTFAFLYREGAIELVIPPEMSGRDEEERVSLDPDTSLGRNVEARFLLAKKLRKGREIGGKRLEQEEDNLARLERDLEQLRAGALSAAEVAAILRAHKLSPTTAKSPAHTGSTQRDQGTKAYRSYWAKDGCELRVGKGPSANDELTKRARANDLWVHVVEGGGSHVIAVAATAPGRRFSPETQRAAAILAIHHSRLRTGAAGEVYVTFKRHLRKTRGLAPGLWLVDQSETLFLRYEAEELSALLSAGAPSK